jgi:hypothetical protein
MLPNTAVGFDHRVSRCWGTPRDGGVRTRLLPEVLRCLDLPQWELGGPMP